MSEGKLNTAVLGLDDKGLRLLEAAAKTSHLQIQAVADKDTKLAERIAAEYSCTPYDDYRQLIIQNKFDCLLIAAGLYTCDEYIRMAMKKKCNILKLAPAARNFAEAAELVRLAEDQDIKFAIANPARFAGGFTALRQFLQESPKEHVSLITAVCSPTDEHTAQWRSDPKLAGGGVLLYNCYEIIDQMIWNFAIPQQVYSLNTSTAGDRQQRLYMTEDTAIVTMKFSDTLFGNIVVSRHTGTSDEEDVLKIYGKDKIVTAGNRRFTISDSSGRLLEQTEYDNEQSVYMAKLLDNFALSLLSPDKNRLLSSGSENLKNMAVIESAYLSGRTSMPEEPGRILQMASSRGGIPTNI